jgi:Lipid A 3-O-deacylase (PagL)
MGKVLLRLATTALALWSALSGSRAVAEEFPILPPLTKSGDCAEEPFVCAAPTCQQCVPDFAYTDAYQDYSQHAIGQAVEFQLKAAAGFHYCVNEHLSLDGEAGYTHISNADLAPRNLGINSVGSTMGITFYFP